MQSNTSALRSTPRFPAVAAIIVLIALSLLWGLRAADVRPEQAWTPAPRPAGPQSAAIALPPPNLQAAKRDGDDSRRNVDIGLAETPGTSQALEGASDVARRLAGSLAG